jgi:hypothetical protein
MSDDASRWATWRSVATFLTVLTGVMGSGVLLAPRLFLRFFGATVAPGTVLFFRAFGASLLYVAVVHQGLKDSRDPRAVRAVLVSNVVEDTLLTLLSAQGVVRGTFGKTGWLLVGAFGSVAALNAWLATRFAEGTAEYVEATR